MMFKQCFSVHNVELDGWMLILEEALGDGSPLMVNGEQVDV